MSLIKIMLCQEDESLGMLLSEYFQAKGIDAELFTNGLTASNALENNNYDLCILDVALPEKDGFALAHDIQKHNSHIPIVFLSNRTAKEDVLTAFRMGADDYITKPFSMEELLLRIEAILRRTSYKTLRNETEYQLGNTFYDTEKHLVIIKGKELRITAKEAEVLTLFAKNANNIVERKFALQTIWGEDNYFNARSMDVYVSRIRKILSNGSNVQLINIHARGYKLIVPNN